MPTIQQLRALDPYEFEHYIADLWERQGWNTRVLQQSNDYGIDVIATKSDPTPQKLLIQAKRYAEDNRVGAPDVQQYRSLLEQEPDADAVVIVTTSDFTKQAREIASQMNVKLVDGDDLQQIIQGTPLKAQPPNRSTEQPDPGTTDDGSTLWAILRAAARDPEHAFEVLLTLLVGIVIIYFFGELLWNLAIA